MNLNIFHFGPHTDDPKNWKMKDKLNSWTGRRQCLFLEWSGWYSFDLAERLLGHYRLFQLFKKKRKASEFNLLPIPAYIVHYRATHGTKYFFSRILAFLYFLSYPKETLRNPEIEGLNRILINEGSSILHNFLETAEGDFERAFRTAIQEFISPEFLQAYANPTRTTPGPTLLLQVNNDNKRITNNAWSYNELNVHTVIKEGAKGKERDVFSKKQVLIFFDLLSEQTTLERIDLGKPGRYKAQAGLLHALTGKGKESFIDEFKDHRTNGLYHFNTEGELKQLIATLTNLSDICDAAGFESIAVRADKKIRELQTKMKRR